VTGADIQRGKPARALPQGVVDVAAIGLERELATTACGLE